MAKVRVGVEFHGKDVGVTSTANKAGGAINKLSQSSEKSSQKMSGSWKKLALGIGGVILAVMQIKKAFDALVGAYERQYKAEVKLASALKATGQQVGITFGEMKQFATEMSRMTAIADEAIIEAQGLMTTFTQIGKDVFPSAIKAAADMSAMFGQELQQSVIQLGTALNDPIRGVGRLRRIGISFTQEQKKMIEGFMESNDVMGAQQVILDELSAEFGGIAEAMGQDAPAAFKNLQNAIGDTMEEIGGAMAKATQPLVEDITNFLRDNQQKIGAIFRNLPEAAKIAFDTVVKIIKRALSFEVIGGTIINFGKAFIDNIIVVAKAMPELILTGLRLMVTPIKNFGAWLGSVFEKIFADAGNFFIDALNVIPFVDIKRMGTKEIDDIGDVWDNTLKEMDSGFAEFSSKLGTTMLDIGKNLLSATGETAKLFAPIIDEAGKQFDDLFKRDAAQQAEMAKQREAAIEKQAAIISALKGVTDAAFEELKKSSDEIVKKYKNVYATELEGLKVREKGVRKDMQNLQNYLVALEKRKRNYEREGQITDDLVAEINEVDRVLDVLDNELNEVQTEIKKSTRDIISVWDFLIGDITGMFTDFVDTAKAAYAGRAGIDVEDLTPEEQTQAVAIGVTTVALTEFANIIMYVVNMFLNLVMSTEAFQNLMNSFNESLRAVVEFAVVPLINAIRPLLIIIIALMAHLANVFAPIFRMLGKLIAATLPFWVAIGRVIISVTKVFARLLPPVMSIIGIIINGLTPVLNILATLFDTLAVILQILNPVFELLAFVVRVVMTPIAILGAIFEWIGNVIHNLGKFINNMIDHFFDPSRWGEGMKRTDLGNMIAEAVARVWAGPTVSDFESELGDLDQLPEFTLEEVFGEDLGIGGEETQFEGLLPGGLETGVRGAGVSVSRVPDIYIHQHFHGPVVGAGGMEEVGEFIVDAVQDYVGIGGQVQWLEGGEE